MKRVLLVLIFIQFSFYCYSQRIYDVVDSTNVEIKEKIDFIRGYYSLDSNYKELWHPKYKCIEQYQFGNNIDNLVRSYTPRQFRMIFDPEIRDVTILNDTLSFVKIKGYFEKNHIITYKYYIVKHGNKLYMDNCLPYEKYRFKKSEVKGIDFYVTPWFSFTKSDFMKAEKEYSDLHRLFGISDLKKIDAFVCAAQEELNILANMEEYYSYVGGFANSDFDFIVSHKIFLFHKHEFVHAILGPPNGGSWFLLEGMATRFGGLESPNDFEFLKSYMKEGYETGRFNFGDLYARKISNKNNNYPTYGLAALICDYVYRIYGIKELIRIYQDPTISDSNLLDVLAIKGKISRAQLETEIESLVR